MIECITGCRLYLWIALAGIHRRLGFQIALRRLHCTLRFHIALARLCRRLRLWIALERLHWRSSELGYCFAPPLKIVRTPSVFSEKKQPHKTGHRSPLGITVSVIGDITRLPDGGIRRGNQTGWYAAENTRCLSQQQQQQQLAPR